MSIQSVMPFNHLILCCPLLLPLSIFFLNKCIYFNWRLITLQYCIVFAIYQHESATSIHVGDSPSWTLLPPPSPYHLSGSSQCTSPKHPVSCIEPGLAICFIYDIIHVSMLFSQIIPPSPSSRVQNTIREKHTEIFDILFESNQKTALWRSTSRLKKLMGIQQDRTASFCRRREKQHSTQ